MPKKVSLGPLNTDMPPVLIPELEKPKRKRTKPEGEPKSVAFKSAKGDVSFTARSRKKLPDPEPVLQDIEDTPKQEASFGTSSQRFSPAEPPGLYELMHEHLNTRANRRVNAWQEFNIF